VQVKRLVFPLSYFACLPGVLFWPFPINFFERLIGKWDVYHFVWTLWWPGYAVRTGRNPFWIDIIYWPVGNSVFQHTHALVQGLMAWPFFGWVTPTVIYNSAVWFNISSAGMGIFCLVRLVVGRGIFPSLVAGTFYAGSGYLALEIRNGHLLSGVSIGFFIWAVTTWIWMEKRRSKGSLWIAGLVGAIASYQHPLYFLFLLFFWVVRSGYGFWKMPDKWRNRGFIKRQSLYATLTTLLSLPILAATKLAGVGIGKSIHFSTDVVSPILPGPFHPLWGRWARELAHRIQENPFESSGYLTFVGILASTYFACRSKDRQWKWWAFCVWAFFSLSLGPQLHILGFHELKFALDIPSLIQTHIAVPLYTHYELLTKLFPPLAGLRVSADFIMISLMGVAVCIGFLCRMVLDSTLAKRNLVAALILAAVVFENAAVPYRTWRSPPFQNHPFFRTLENDRDGFAILELPFRPHHSFGTRNYMQMSHRHPTIGGYISRPDPSHRERWKKDAFLSAIVRLEESPNASDARRLAEQEPHNDYLRALRKLGVRYVTLEMRTKPSSKTTALKLFLERLPFLERVYAGEGFFAWRVQ
jgi:hypothetical protein